MCLGSYNWDGRCRRRCVVLIAFGDCFFYRKRIELCTSTGEDLRCNNVTAAEGLIGARHIRIEEFTSCRCQGARRVYDPIPRGI